MSGETPSINPHERINTTSDEAVRETIAALHTLDLANNCARDPHTTQAAIANLAHAQHHLALASQAAARAQLNLISTM